MRYALQIVAAVSLVALSGSDSADTNATPAEPAAAQAIAHKLDETASADGVDFTVTAVEERDFIGASGQGFATEPGETFVVVSYTLKNTSGAPLELFNRPALSLSDAAGQTYSQDDASSIMAAMMLDDPSGMASDLNPGVSAKTVAVWKVSKETFDRGSWKLTASTSPALTFALK